MGGRVVYHVSEVYDIKMIYILLYKILKGGVWELRVGGPGARKSGSAHKGFRSEVKVGATTLDHPPHTFVTWSKPGKCFCILGTAFDM